jgi:hypothetical protein
MSVWGSPRSWHAADGLSAISRSTVAIVEVRDLRRLFSLMPAVGFRTPA